jgi:sugar phosphate isomerase/epimerase
MIFRRRAETDRLFFVSKCRQHHTSEEATLYVKGIGLNIDTGWIDGDLERLTDMLARVAAMGYDAAELTPHSVDAILHGQLDRRQVASVRKITSSFPLHYSVHAPNRLNVAHHEDLELQIQVFRACLDFCAEVEADLFVYHSGQMGLERAASGLAPLPTPEALEGYWTMETANLTELADYAARRGVTIAIENRDPHLWEIAALAHAGYPSSALPTFHGGMCLDLLCAQVQKIGASNVGLTLDIGHAYLAAPFWSMDFSRALAHAAPYIRHLHWHDNFGRLDGLSAAQHDRLPNGEGDLHLPPGRGSIPLDTVRACLDGYEGWLTMEIRPRFRAHYREALVTTRAFVAVPWETPLPHRQHAEVS